MNSSQRPRTAAASALANPYMSSHYYQAYVQAYSHGPPRTDGHTHSSTHTPDIAGGTAPSLCNPSSVQAIKPVLNHLTHGNWYQPGNTRCTRSGCPFTGSRKSVEIHMMDRHFVFPFGWKKKEDWDADLSLRGKQIAIQGTSITLDTQEAVDAWIAERKRRFPTDEKVLEKKRKLEEAMTRGELTMQDIDGDARRRYRHTENGGRGSRGYGRQRGRGRRGQGMNRRERPRVENPDGSVARLADETTKSTWEASLPSTSVADDDEAPEVVSSKIPTVPLCIQEAGTGEKIGGKTLPPPPQECTRRVAQPKKPPRNPFASRSTLLRNVLGSLTFYLFKLPDNLPKLLLPEIRITISNLSQAIRFLVENNFLRDVELRPGEAQEQMIEVLGSSYTACSERTSTENSLEPSDRV